MKSLAWGLERQRFFELMLCPKEPVSQVDQQVRKALYFYENSLYSPSYIHVYIGICLAVTIASQYTIYLVRDARLSKPISCLNPIRSCASEYLRVLFSFPMTPLNIAQSCYFQPKHSNRNSCSYSRPSVSKYATSTRQRMNWSPLPISYSLLYR